MDRTAWIVVALCVIGLVDMGSVSGKADGAQTGSRQRCAWTDFGHSDSCNPGAFAIADLPRPKLRQAGRESTPSFAEKIETLRNSDVRIAPD